MKEYNLKTEPKFIVFFTQLLTPLQICRVCKSDKTLVEVNSHGTMAEVKTTCVNPDCGERTNWFSQPYFPGTKIAAGNLLLSFGSAQTYGNDMCLFDNFLQISTSKFENYVFSLCLGKLHGHE